MKSTSKLTRSAVMLALTIVFQSLRLLPFVGNLPHSALIVGSLVNMCLYLCSLTTDDYSGGLLISVCAPTVAYFQGHLAFVCLIPFVAVGNAMLVVCFYFLRKSNKYAAVVISAAAKWAVMFFSSKYLLHFFLPIDYDKLKIIIAGFNMPQLITAVIGGILAIAVCGLLPRSLKNTDK